jgi:nitrogen fixation protein FixH
MTRLKMLSQNERAATIKFNQALEAARAKEAEALQAVLATGAAAVQQAQERNAKLAINSLADAQVNTSRQFIAL